MAEVSFSQKSSGKIERVFGRFYTARSTIVTGSAQSSISLNAALDGGRLNAIADLYRFYRFTMVKVHFAFGSLTSSGTGSDTNNGAMVAFSKGSITLPTTAFEISQIENYQHFFGCQTEPSVLKLSKKDLLSMHAVKWFQTTSVGDAELDTQGTFVFCTIAERTGLAVANTTSLNMVFEFWCEFMDRVPAAVSIERLRREHAILVVDEEKEQFVQKKKQLLQAVKTLPKK